MWFLSVGGGIGFLATYCAKRIGSDRVTTFEANPFMERIIRVNPDFPNEFLWWNGCLLCQGNTVHYKLKNIGYADDCALEQEELAVSVPLAQGHQKKDLPCACIRL